MIEKHSFQRSKETSCTTSLDEMAREIVYVSIIIYSWINERKQKRRWDSIMHPEKDAFELFYKSNIALTRLLKGVCCKICTAMVQWAYNRKPNGNKMGKNPTNRLIWKLIHIMIKQVNKRYDFNIYYLLFEFSFRSCTAYMLSLSLLNAIAIATAILIIIIIVTLVF